MNEKLARVLTPALLLAVVVTGLTMGWFLFRNEPLGSSVTFEPAILDLRSKPVFVGEVIAHQARLVNRMGSPVTVEGLGRSCGCMSFLDSTQREFPRRLQPGESLPIMVEVHTEGRTGLETFTIQAIGRDAQGVPFNPDFSITASIHSGPMPSPMSIEDYVPPEEAGQQKRREIVLADETELAPYGMPVVSSSAPARFRFEVGASSPDKVSVQGLTLSSRHVIKIADQLPTRPGEYLEDIFVDFPNTKFPRIKIPVKTHVEPDVSWSPRQFTLIKSAVAGEKPRSIVRVIRFRSHRKGTLMVADPDDLPTGVSARHLAEAGSDPCDITYELQFDPTTIERVSQVYFRFADGRRVSIPVEWL